jgi:hypothetical protein
MHIQHMAVKISIIYKPKILFASISDIIIKTMKQDE